MEHNEASGDAELAVDYGPVSWEGRSVFVAGGGRGIGAAVARHLGALGASVVVADLEESWAAEVAEQVVGAGGVASSVAVDVTSLAGCRAAITYAAEQHGRVHSLISTVGWSDTTMFLDETEDYWQRIVAINLMGVVNISRAAVEHMRDHGGGSIVLTSSDAGKVGTTGETVYAGAKAGVIGFTKSLAREVARYGIRVNATSPGPTATPLLLAQSHQGVVEKMVRAIPLRRIAEPIEQARVAVFLASDAASYVTGQTLSVSGGLTMGS